MKIGFIGCGNMAKAMIQGMLNHGIMAQDVMVSTTNETTLTLACDTYNVLGTLDNCQVVEQSEIIILAIKPHLIEKVLYQVKEKIMKHHIIVSISPGKTIDWFNSILGNDIKIVRTMPNTPSLVGEGMSAISPSSLMSKDDINKIDEIFSTFGRVEIVEERLMDAVVAISGSSPAYIFILIEAMADAGVLLGLPRASAYRFASQAVLGSAKMVQGTNLHPATLKDQVTSSGGSTIEAIRTLEEKGFRSAIIEAMVACAQKSNQMK